MGDVIGLHPGLLIAIPLLLGLVAIWLAHAVRLPLALLLLGSGWALQAVTGFVTPEVYKTQLSFLALALSLLFFEGGRRMGTLALSGDGPMVGHLVAYGAKISWVAMAALAGLILGTPTDISLLLGALLLIMAPYSVADMVGRLRGERRWTSVLSWETQALSCLAGAWAVLIISGIMANQSGHPSIVSILKVTLKVALAGAGAAWVAFQVMKSVRDSAPPELADSLKLGLVLLACGLSQTVAYGSGIMAASVLGYLEGRDPEHSSQLGPHLNLIVLAMLGVHTGAILSIHGMFGPDWVRDLIFALAVVLGLRPLVVWLGAGRKKVVEPRMLRGLELVHPRGIITLALAASVGQWLSDVNHPQALRLVPVTAWVVLVSQLLPWVMAWRVGPVAPAPEPPQDGREDDAGEPGDSPGE